MRELEVLKATIEYAERRNWSVLCMSPPGGTAYIWPACRFLGPSGEQDEPDVVITKSGVLIFVECKPTFSGLLRPNRDGENDIGKLKRLQHNMLDGAYDTQVKTNYELNAESIEKVEIAIAYGGEFAEAYCDLTHFVVRPNGRTSVYGKLL